MRKWFSSSSSHRAVTHNDVYRTHSPADSNDDTSSSLRSPRRRSTELGNALTSLRNAREEGLRKLWQVEIQTTPAERQRNEIVSQLEQRTETVKSNLTLCQNALAPDSYVRFEVSPDRQIGNALQSAETVTAEWKKIRRTVEQAISE